MTSLFLSTWKGEEFAAEGETFPRDNDGDHKRFCRFLRQRRALFSTDWFVSDISSEVDTTGVNLRKLCRGFAQIIDTEIVTYETFYIFNNSTNGN